MSFVSFLKGKLDPGQCIKLGGSVQDSQVTIGVVTFFRSHRMAGIFSIQNMKGNLVCPSINQVYFVHSLLSISVWGIWRVK